MNKSFINILIIGGFILILLSPLLLLPDIFEARQFCISNNLTYSLNLRLESFCDDLKINKYYSNIEQRTYWEYEQNFPYKIKLNFSEFS
jgi:hypothetical protein